MPTTTAWTRPEVIPPPAQDYALIVKHVTSPGFEQMYFLQFDVHYDSPECAQKLYHRHMRLVKERNALVIDGGDFLDVISGRNDKRSTKSTARPEHGTRSDYLDAVVEDAARDLAPYADQFIYFGTGNHESKVLKMCETDLTRRLIEKLEAARTPGLPPIHRAGYGGWIKFQFAYPGTDRGSNKQSFALKVFHGVGGGGEVTKGTMEAQRMSATIRNADIVATGHVHEKWSLDVVQESLSASGRVVLRERKHVKVGSYKQDYRTDGAPTWHMQRPGGTPKPLGGVFLRFHISNPATHAVGVDVIPASVDYGSLE